MNKENLEIKIPQRVKVKVTLEVSVDILKWADYHRVTAGVDETLRQAVKADAKDYFENNALDMNEKMGPNFTEIAEIL